MKLTETQQHFVAAVLFFHCMIVLECRIVTETPSFHSAHLTAGPHPGTGAPPSGRANWRAAFIWAGPREKGHVEMEIPEAAA